MKYKSFNRAVKNQLLKVKSLFQCKPLIEPKENEFLLLIFPIIIYILYIFKVIPSFFYGNDHNIFIALYSVTIGYRYIYKYISPVKGKISNIFLEMIFILILSGLLTKIISSFMNNKDPQNLQNFNITLEHFIKYDFMHFIFVGIGEELFCFFILMIFLIIFQFKYRLIISVVITSLIFGLLHGIKWGILCTIPIGITHIPFVYSYNKFKSIIPAMLAHSLVDMLVTLNIVFKESIINILISFIFPIIVIIMIIKFKGPNWMVKLLK